MKCFEMLMLIAHINMENLLTVNMKCFEITPFKLHKKQERDINRKHEMF